MSESPGRCPHCESQGAIGSPCAEAICSRHSYHFIPEEDFALLELDGEEPVDPWIGTKMDEYLITGFLGRGGFGRVYLTRQLPILLKAALKILNFDTIPDSGRKKITEKFEIEAKALASLSHPNIVRLLKYGFSGDRPYLVMEFVKGGRDLKNAVYDRMFRGEKPNPRESLKVIHQVVNALDAAHRNPVEAIIHRDIKPENIMLHDVPENPNFVKVLDFGLAKFVAGSGETTSIMGTPVYMAPEQLTRSDIGPWTDLYALGVITFELTTGLCPFEGETHSEVIADKINPDFDPMDRLENKDLPETVRAFYRKALAQNPADRYQNAKEFRAALRSFEAALMDGAEESDDGAAPPLLDQRQVQEKSVYDETVTGDEISSADPPEGLPTPMGVPSFNASDGEKGRRYLFYGLIGGLVTVLALIFLAPGSDKPGPQVPSVVTHSAQGSTVNNRWSGLADSPIWKKGNKWNLHVVRVAGANRIDEGAPLDFVIRREIERVESGDQGALRVGVWQTGGLLKPKLRVFEVSEHCITELSNSSRKWCVDDFAKEAKTVEVLGGTTQVFDARADSYKLRFSQEMGWIREEQRQGGTGRKTTRTLKGALIGGVEYGNARQIPMPCSWNRSMSEGEPMGHADAGQSPEAQSALEAGMEGPIYAYKLKLSGQYGFEQVRALRDESRTMVELVGTNGIEILTTGTLKYRLEQMKIWVNKNERAEYVILKFRDSRSTGVLVIRLAVDGITTQLLTVPQVRGSHHSMALVSYGECLFQIQRVKAGSRKVQRYRFGAEQLEKSFGSLKVRSRSISLRASGSEE